MPADLHLSADQIDEALRRGLLQPQDVAALQRLADEAQAPAPPPREAQPVQRDAQAAQAGVDAAFPGDGDEPFRLVGGGNDVFVALGIILLLNGVWVALLQVFPKTIVACAAMAVFLWATAEFVTRRQRMKLSSLILSVAFTLVHCTGVASHLAQTVNFSPVDNPVQLLQLRDEIWWVAMAAIGSVACVVFVWFARFRVPVMSAVLALAVLAFAAIGVADSVVDNILAWRTPVSNVDDALQLGRSLLWVPLIMGLAVFAIGVFLDLKDRHRDTILSDCAFWMHVLSAPLIVHPLFVLATGTMPFFGHILPIETGGADASATVTLLPLVAVFFYIALAIDRRSLLVPALGYFATVGIVSLVNAAATTTGIPVFAIILALVGMTVILFGAGWQTIRALVVGPTLPAGIVRHLPPLRAGGGASPNGRNRERATYLGVNGLREARHE